MSSKNYSGRKYHVVPYDPQWKRQFLFEADMLGAIFGDQAIAIEHVGSTSVSGLSGKPTVDVLVTVTDTAVADRFTGRMKRSGYEALGAYVLPGSRLFVREENNTRLCNVHVFPKDHPHVREMLQMRDYLMAHPDIAAEYGRLKLDLFQKYPNDYGTYRKYKDEYMKELQQLIDKEG